MNPMILKFAFLTLVKTSAMLHPPQTRGRHMESNGISLRCTRYDDAAMNKVFGSLFLPIVSSRDSLFLKRVFERSHVDYILKNPDLLFTTNLSLGQTLQVARRGILCVESSGLG